MGLDFSHGDAHWSYVGFNVFRKDLAQHEGINLDLMRGFTRAPWNGWSWDNVTTPLKPLLNHSDCDGHLTPDECRQVAPALREVITILWSPHLGEGWYAQHSRVNGLALADAMDECAETGENLEFC